MSKNKFHQQFIKSNVIQFETINIELNTNDSIDQIREKMNEMLSMPSSIPMLFHVQFSGDADHYQLYEDGILEELKTIYNEENMLAKQWSYIYKYIFILKESPAMKSNHFFISEVEKSIHQIKVNEAVSELFNHHEMRKYVERIDESYIKQRATELLMNELTESRRNE